MTDRNQILEFLQNNNDLFKAKYHIRKIGLFGSYARNEAKENSDIDIILEFEDNTQNLHEIKQELTALLAGRFNTEIDIAREKYLKPRAKQTILQEAVYVK